MFYTFYLFFTGCSGDNNKLELVASSFARYKELTFLLMGCVEG
jgi:hypothetical protein